MKQYNFDKLSDKYLTDIERDIKIISQTIDTLDKSSKDYLSDVKQYTKMLSVILEKQIANMNMAVNGHTLQNRVVIINGVETWIPKQQGLGSKIPDRKNNNKMLNCSDIMYASEDEHGWFGIPKGVRKYLHKSKTASGKDNTIQLIPTPNPIASLRRQARAIRSKQELERENKNSLSTSIIINQDNIISIHAKRITIAQEFKKLVGVM